MKRSSFALASLACLAAQSLSASELLLPPPYVAVTIESNSVEGTRIETGQRYSVYVMHEGNGTHSALLVDASGLVIHEGVPAYVKSCNDTAMLWPDSANARLELSSDPDVAQLRVPASKLNPCLLILELPLVARNTTPARPNPGIPN